MRINPVDDQTLFRLPRRDMSLFDSGRPFIEPQIPLTFLTVWAMTVKTLV
jgi:hypothetical protein